MCLRESCSNARVQFLLSIVIWAVLTGSFVSGDDDGTEHITAILGESVVLNCAIDFPDGIAVPYIIQWEKKGNKIPIFIWYDGYPPHRGEGYEGRISLHAQASINITEVQPLDQGWYECKVFFLNRPPDSTKNGTWVYLSVHAPPIFTVIPQDVIYVKIGDSIDLMCDAIGTPKPSIVWYKDAQPLEPSANVNFYNNGLGVKVTSLRHNDIGDYVCEASNGEGHVQHPTKVIVAGGAVITVPPYNISKLEGEKIEFVCEAKALPGNITHKWYRNNVDIKELSWLETRTMIKRDGTLVIHPLSADDTGRYTCEVSNGIGTPQTASAHLDVEYPARVTYTPTVQYLPLGLPGVVRCHIESNPVLQFVTWTKDKRLFEPNQIPGVSSMPNGSLQFQKVSTELQGRYTCTPYNTHSTSGASGVMEVVVRDPPTFTVKPQPQYQKPVNNDVKMNCEAQGSPKPEIIWRRADGSKLPRDRTTFRGGEITIRQLRKSDYGHYECVVQNEVATLVSGTLLLVENSTVDGIDVSGTTPHPPYNVTVETSAFDATVQWVPGYDGGKQQHYNIWYRESFKGDTSWRIFRVPSEGAATKFIVFNLTPETEYDFRVVSRNELGDSQPSEIVKAKTKPVDKTQQHVFPTDGYGSTYVPTIVRPADSPTFQGPKPDQPRSVAMTEVTGGFLISWLPPLSKLVPPVYYMIEFKLGEEDFKPLTNDVIKSLSYTVPIRNLIGGKNYIFRVYACTMTSCSSASIDYKFLVPERSHKQAVTAGLVGGILFLIASIVLSICAVKICNQRKKKRREKAYNMVACRITDARNGGHASPVPLKKRKLKHQIFEDSLKSDYQA